jgi:hypothetical protein
MVVAAPKLLTSFLKCQISPGSHHSATASWDGEDHTFWSGSITSFGTECASQCSLRCVSIFGLVDPITHPSDIQSVSTGQEHFSCLAPIHIRRHKKCPAPGDSVALYRVDFSTATLAHAAIAAVQPSYAASDLTPSINNTDSSSAWIPGPVLVLALPEVWREFVRKKGALTLPLHPPQVRSFMLVPCT